MDAFTCQWLNRLDQFGATDIDLIVTHDQKVIPPQRTSRHFFSDGKYETIDEKFLTQAATNEVARIVQEWNDANPWP